MLLFDATNSMRSELLAGQAKTELVVQQQAKAIGALETEVGRLDQKKVGWSDLANL